MKKIPTLFEREFKNHRIVKVLPDVTDGFEWVLNGEGVPTVKYDGSCCAILDGKFYKRFDAKKGRKAPENAIPCCEPDKITGHHPHWVEVDENNPADKWFIQALRNSKHSIQDDGTYEAIGKHFNGNPYHLKYDTLIKHGKTEIHDLPNRSFECIKEYLESNYIEGIVFWKDGEPQCKIKRTDFGYKWGNR